MKPCDLTKEERYHKLYMSIAVACSQMSHAVRKKVGAILVKDGRILSQGWNGMPTGMDNTCERKVYCLSKDLQGNYFPGTDEEYPFEDNQGRYRLETLPQVLHAELNCLAKLARSGESSSDSTMYVTLQPCVECAKLIIQTGIKKIYYLEKYRCDQGLELLTSAGVEVIQLDQNGQAVN